MKYLQQGDVLLHCQKIPKSATEVITNPVVEYGEHTGHAHRLSFDMAGAFKENHGGGEAPLTKCRILKDPKSGERYLKVDETVDLNHEEHKTISIPPGEYRIGRVLEYDHFAEEARVVQD
jgi:hypothetical protein